MTPNTSPEKPAWFALIENDAPSAQVRKVDKKLPAATALAALAIVASGTFFANGSLTSEAHVSQNSVGTLVASNLASQSPASSSLVNNTKLAAPQSLNGIADPTLNRGGDDEYDNEEDDGYDDEDEAEDEAEDEDDKDDDNRD